MPPPPITGHSAVRARLMQDLESGNLAHAYLFAGQKHLGKMTIARWFAEEILLHDVPPSEKEEVRHRLHNLTHPDLILLDKLWVEDVSDDWDMLSKFSNIRQVHRSKAPKAKQDVIGIDDVRELKQQLYETGEGKRRVCIIRSVERMQDAAANALLKILEEPPPGRVFILTTESPESLLSTIRSRARVCNFTRLGDKEIETLIGDMESVGKQFILRASQGAPGFAMMLKNDPEALRHEKDLHAAAMSFWSTPSMLRKLQDAAPLLERGSDADRLLLHLALVLRSDPLVTPQKVRALTQLAERLHTNVQRQLVVQDFVMRVNSENEVVPT